MARIQATIRIDQTKMRELIGFLKAVEKAFGPIGLRAMFTEAARRMAETVVLEYPPQSHAPMADLWTDKQRRWFFWAKAHGRIQVPYERSFKLGRSLRYKLTLKQMEAIVMATIPNAGPMRYVIGQRQSRYFRERTGWKPLRNMLQDQRPAIDRAVEQAIVQVYFGEGR